MPRGRDARRIAQIEAAAWREAYRRLLPAHVLHRLGTEERVLDWMNRIRFVDRGRAVRVIRHDGLIAGYVTFGPAHHPDLEPGFAGEIHELYVHPELQGQGIGRRMLAAALQELDRAGWFWGVLEVLRDNAAARRFYEACGLQTSGEVRHRAAGHRSGMVRGHRYSRPRSTVSVVRYEGPLRQLDWTAG